MIVLVNGMVRSGSTWSYNVVMELMRRRFGAKAIHGGSSESTAEYLADAPDAARQLVVKCHRLDPAARTLARTGAARVVFTVRDPWDAVASGMRAFDATFGQALELVTAGLEALAFHRVGGTASIVGYPAITGDPEVAIRQMGGYLFGEWPRDWSARGIAARTGLETMRKKVEAINRTGKRKLVKAENLYHDPESLLYQNHIVDGSSGYGRAYLTAGQIKMVAGRVARYKLEKPLERYLLS